MAGIISRAKTPHEVLDWIRTEWDKIRKEKAQEKGAEIKELKMETGEKRCKENLTRITKQIEDELVKYANLLRQNLPENKLKSSLVPIRSRLLELMKQYRYFFGQLKKIRAAETNLAKLETQDLEDLEHELNEINRLLHHTP